MFFLPMFFFQRVGGVTKLGGGLVFLLSHVLLPGLDPHGHPLLVAGGPVAPDGCHHISQAVTGLSYRGSSPLITPLLVALFFFFATTFPCILFVTHFHFPFASTPLLFSFSFAGTLLTLL